MDERDSLPALQGEWTFRRRFHTPPFVFAQMLWLHRKTLDAGERSAVLSALKQSYTRDYVMLSTSSLLLWLLTDILLLLEAIILCATVCILTFLGILGGVYMIHLLFENTGGFMMHSWRSNVQNERDKSVQMVQAVLLLPEIIITCLWASLYGPLSTVRTSDKALCTFLVLKLKPDTRD